VIFRMYGSSVSMSWSPLEGFSLFSTNNLERNLPVRTVDERARHSPPDLSSDCSSTCQRPQILPGSNPPTTHLTGK